MTLRQALRVLEIQGLITRQRGSGTYVTEPKIEREAGRLFPFTKGIQRQGYLPGAQVIMLEQRPAEVALANKLQISVSASVYHGHRLRFINQQPMMLEKFFLPAHRFPRLETLDLESRSLYEVMETEYGTIVNRAQQSLEAVTATVYEAGLLDVEPGAPLMLEQRLTFDQNGQPVEYATDVYRGDRFRFVTELAALDL
jgi:GntR family transcriptional regulator